MLAGGEDPLFIARRLVRAASEDIGEADPTSLILANAAKDAYDFLGSPEGELALAQLVVHLAAAPKSNAVYAAFGAAMRAAKETGSLMPPAHIRNAPTRLMKELGYGKGYAYDHDAEDGFSGQNYFPEGMERQTFYAPKGEAPRPGEGAPGSLVRLARAKEPPVTPARVKMAKKSAASAPNLSADEIALVRSLVIHEDEHIIALAKPSGLSSQGGRGQANTLDELLFAFARSNGARPRLIHRLDRDTSGVILTAKKHGGGTSARR